jgi:enoyl-CoA hydratase
MDFQHVALSREGRVGWLAYNRPPINAFDHTLLREVPAALQALLDDPRVRVIVFASALERYFSAGAELRLFEGIGSDGMREWVGVCHDLVRRMRAAPKPLLAAIHGTAVGGGLEMVLHCDLRFAAADARLGQPEIAIGFIPPVGTTQSLARLLGRPRALRFLYEGRLHSAAEALELGLVDFVLPPERLRAEVQAYAEGLAAKPAQALAAIRRCITEGGERPFEEGLSIERTEAIRLAGTPDFVEGVRAFLAKRDPRWEG